MHSQTLGGTTGKFPDNFSYDEARTPSPFKLTFWIYFTLGVFVLTASFGRIILHDGQAKSDISVASINWSGKSGAHTSLYPRTDKLWQPETKNCQKNLPQVQVNRRKIIHKWWLHHGMIKQKRTAQAGRRAKAHCDWQTCTNTDRDVDVTPIVNIYFYRDNFRILNKAVHIFRLASQSICSLFFYDWTKGSIY